MISTARASPKAVSGNRKLHHAMGHDQRTLGAALGVDERAVRFWERKHDRKPTGSPNDRRIEQCLLEHGVILFAEPTAGARLDVKR